MAYGRKKRTYYKQHFNDLSINIPWKDWVYILTKHYRFEMILKSGSIRAFERGGIKFIAHEPHGGGDDFVHRYDRKKSIRAIEMLKTLEEIGGIE